MSPLLEERNRSVQQLLEPNGVLPATFEDEGFLESESEEENIEELEKRAVKNLCGELLEEVFDDDSFQIGKNADSISVSNNSGAKSSTRKTCKLRVSRKYKNSLK